MMKAYDQLLAAAARLGLPLHYKDDLLKHDKEMLEKFNPPEFAWAIREHGTHLIIVDCEMSAEWGLACSKSDGEKGNYFIFSKGELKPCSMHDWNRWIRRAVESLPKWLATVEWSGQWCRPYRDMFTVVAAQEDDAREVLKYRLENCNRAHTPRIVEMKRALNVPHKELAHVG